MSFDILGSDFGLGNENGDDPNESSRLQSFPTTSQNNKFSAAESPIPHNSFQGRHSAFESSNEKNQIGN